jgi:hypothetical protein
MNVYMFDDKCEVAMVGKWHDRWCVTHRAYLLDCLECGKYFHSARPHTKYCSNACRQRAYRKRSKQQNLAGGAA